MEEEKEKEEKDIFGEEYQNFDKPFFNVSQGTWKNDTGANTHKNNSKFDKNNDLEEYQYPQTELNKDKKRTKEKLKLKHKNSIAENSPGLNKVLQKKTSRAEGPTKKKKKTKSDMDFTLQNKTEVNREDKKKEIESKVYSMYNQEHFFDIYDTPSSATGDLFNSINEDEASAEVNNPKPIYNTTINNEIPESFKMCISSELNQ